MFAYHWYTTKYWQENCTVISEGRHEDILRTHWCWHSQMSLRHLTVQLQSGKKKKNFSRYVTVKGMVLHFQSISLFNLWIQSRPWLYECVYILCHASGILSVCWLAAHLENYSGPDRNRNRNNNCWMDCHSWSQEDLRVTLTQKVEQVIQ